MGERNKHGLGRTIPPNVKREVRKRCGFGCVRCGLAWYDYEHFDPDFKDAHEHLPAGITLLCMQCNQKRRRGVLSAETVAEADKNPRCLAEGFASETWDFSTEQLEVIFAGNSFLDCDDLIQLNGVAILSLRAPEEARQPIRVFGKFSDDTGDVTLVIEDNVFRAGADNWDVECVGPRITIRNGPRNISLVIKTEPPHRLIIERLNMQFEGIHLVGSQDELKVSLNGKDWVTFAGCSAQYSPVGMAFANR